MTTFYNPDDINSRHAVYFPEPKHIDNLHYYDSEKKWRKCEILTRLPYDLATYRFSDSTDGKVFVTCTDSYRLSTDPQSENIDLDYEESWRNQICQKDCELDFNNKGNWVKAQVCWPKSDIVPGVVLIGPRKYSNINCFGYIYKESKTLGKSGSHTRVITQEELNKEIEQEEKHKSENQKIKTKLEELKKNTSKYVPEKFSKWREPLGGGDCSFYDIRKFYSYLRKERREIIPSLIDKSDLKNGSDPETFSPTDLALLWLVKYKDCDVCFVGKTQKSDKNYDYDFLSTKGDAVFDLRIKNATYAKYCPNGQKSELLQPIDMKKDGSDFILEGISLDNPLFNSCAGASHTFETDGDLIEYKEIYINLEPRSIMIALSSYAVSWLTTGKVIFCGHMWMPSLIIDEKELVEVKD
jgi:hypothetical protein